MKNKLYRWLVYGHPNLKTEWRWGQYSTWHKYTRLDEMFGQLHGQELKTTYFSQENKVKSITITYLKEY